MKEYKDSELDPILHQPVRTKIVAYLATRGTATFTELKQALNITDGNLEGHIKKLSEAKYISNKRKTGKGRPQTVYSLTSSGLAAFTDYVRALQKLLPSNLNV